MLYWVKQVAQRSDYTYGSRRIKEVLKALNFPVSREKTRKLMKEAKVRVRRRRKYKVTTHSNHTLPLFDNLLKRECDVKRSNQAYVSDIIYIWTQEGWLYLAVTIDLFSRKVVGGGSMSSRIKAQMVCDALTMAIWQRPPSEGFIHHSERGSQYARHNFRKLLKIYGIKGSMSHKGECGSGSFFGTLKQERVHWQHYQIRYEDQQDILQYLSMFYKSKRLHSYLGYMSPNEFENKNLELQNVA